MNVPACACGGVADKVILSAPLGIVFGRFEAFVSPVDGSIIRTAREMREHNLRNNVVNLADGYDEKRILAGDYGKKEELSHAERKEDVAEAIGMLQQGYKPLRGADDVAIGFED
jgi:hypothetical protein